MKYQPCLLFFNKKHESDVKIQLVTDACLNKHHTGGQNAKKEILFKSYIYPFYHVFIRYAHRMFGKRKAG